MYVYKQTFVFLHIDVLLTETHMKDQKYGRIILKQILGR